MQRVEMSSNIDDIRARHRSLMTMMVEDDEWFEEIDFRDEFERAHHDRDMLLLELNKLETSNKALNATLSELIRASKNA
jgi:hypothetical protein